MRFRHWWTAIGIAIAAGVSILWWQHKQAVTLPQPTGRFAVGRAAFDWRDAARVDPLAPASGTLRELTVWMWYPAASSGGPTAEYMPAALREALLRHMGPPLRLLTHDLARVRVHAIHNAAFAGGKYPVVLFKPGIGTLALDYTSLAEDLASHGFVVVASDSPFSTAVVVYNDGRVVGRTRTGHPVDEGGPPPSRDAIEKVLRVWVDDDRFILSQLLRMREHLDLESIGAYGHSFGGAAALQFCVEEPRCKGAVDIDGAPFGDVAQRTAIDKPLLFLLSDHANDRSPQDDAIRASIDAIRKRLRNEPNYVVVAGSRHFNFSDDALTKNARVARLFGLIGPIDERRALASTASVINKFFDRYLKQPSS